MSKKEYITVDDYGTGGIWYYMLARSKNEIEKKYPGLDVLEKEPDWFDDAIRDTLEHVDIDDEPTNHLKTMMKK